MSVPAQALRKDIEGLRALAILAVVFGHAGVPQFAGGFVGVDVFFVISGYLITAILARLATEPTPSLADFYARRLRRLLPALLVTQLVTIALAVLVLSPREQIEQARAAASTVAWVSNFLFAFESIDYFGSSANRQLFLHTWSLAVEEQFYLVWPALLFLSAGVFGAGSRNPRRPLWVLAAVVLLGFVFSLAQTFLAPLQAYYLLPARCWQFALGGALALWRISRHAPTMPTTWRRPLAGAGLLAILAAVLLLDGSRPYPGAWALLPTLGAAFVLAAGDDSVERGGVLASPPMQWIGRHSYGWYLWHWPLLLLGQALLPRSGVVVALALALLALGLAVLSLRWIEAPVRGSARLAARPRLTIGLALLGMCVGVLVAQAWGAQARTWSTDVGQVRIETLDPGYYPIYTRGCEGVAVSSELFPCVFGPDEAPRTLVLVGDSIGMHWFPALQAAYPAPEWQLVVLTKSACPMIDVPFYYTRIGRTYVECENWRNAAVKLIERNRPDLVVVGSAASPQFTDDELREGSQRILRRLAAGTGRVVVLAPSPTLGFDGRHCLARQEWRPRWLRSIGACTVALAQAAHPRDHRLLSEAVASLGNVPVIRLDDLVCPDGRCAASVGGQIVYRDGKHLTGEFVASLAPAIKFRIDAALAATPSPVSEK